MSATITIPMNFITFNRLVNISLPLKSFSLKVEIKSQHKSFWPGIQVVINPAYNFRILSAIICNRKYILHGRRNSKRRGVTEQISDSVTHTEIIHSEKGGVLHIVIRHVAGTHKDKIKKASSNVGQITGRVVHLAIDTIVIRDGTILKVTLVG